MARPVTILATTDGRRRVDASDQNHAGAEQLLRFIILGDGVIRVISPK